MFVRSDKLVLISVRSLAAVLAIGLVLAAAYFVARSVILGTSVVSTQTGGRYGLSLTPGFILRNLAVFYGGNLTAIDSIALFLSPRNLPLVAATGLASLPFIIWLVVCMVRLCRKRRGLVSFLTLAALSLIAASPYFLMVSAGEMHAYQLTPYVSLLVALFLVHVETSRKILCVVFSLFFASSCFASVHKWIDMNDMGQIALSIGQEVYKSYDGEAAPENVVGISVFDTNEPLYSVFKESPADAAVAGRMASSFWWWHYPVSYTYIEQRGAISDDQIFEKYADAISQSDSVWIVRDSTGVEVLKRGEDY